MVHVINDHDAVPFVADRLLIFRGEMIPIQNKPFYLIGVFTFKEWTAYSYDQGIGANMIKS